MRGQKFGRLTAIEPTDKRRNRCVVWRFRCDCGKIVERVGSDVRNGDTQSCGCLHDELASERGKTISRTHGGYYDRLHRVWTGMLTRCRNSNHPEFYRYGGRGIKVCAEWERSYQAFKEWAYSHGYDDTAPRGECTIDRVSVDGGYCPENCRFISVKEQNRNLSTNRKITIAGKAKCIAEWARIVGVTPSAIYGAERFRHIAPEKYITQKLLARYGDTAAALTAYHDGHDTGRRGYADAVLDAAEEWKGGP